MATLPPGLDVEAEIDRLYQLPLDAFVEARNALAGRLRSGGDKEGAARVKALARPNAAAWAANQVYWQARREFDALVASAERLQAAQLPGASGDTGLRDAMKARREAQDAALRSATSLLTSAGHSANPATLLRVANTLEAVAAGGARSGQPRPGRLAEDLEPPGFEAFAASAIGDAPRAPSPVVQAFPVRGEKAAREPEPAVDAVEAARAKAESAAEEADARRAEEEQLRAALADRERALDRERRASREAAGALSVARKRTEAARAELEEAKRRFERAQERVALLAEDEAAKGREAERLDASREAAEAERDVALRALRAAEAE